jgi:hypothetical protein
MGMGTLYPELVSIRGRLCLLKYVMARPSDLPDQIHRAIAGDGLASVKVQHFPNGRDMWECPAAAIIIDVELEYSAVRSTTL